MPRKKKVRTGPPQRYTPQQVKSALVHSHGLTAHAAKVLGCSQKTIYRYIHKYPSLKTCLHEQKELLKDIAENRLYKLIAADNLTAIIFFLKTRAQDRGYIEQVRQEHTGEVVYRVKLPENLPVEDPSIVHENAAKDLADRNSRSVPTPTHH